jgi:hypothetical protein
VRGPALLSARLPAEYWFSIQVPCNRYRHGFHIIEYIFVAESHDFPTGLFESLLPRLIIRAGVVMISTIDFHDQSCFDTSEVSNEWLDWELSPELEAAQTPTTQHGPKQRFRLGLPLPQISSPRYGG